jgi:hypothetical protein
MSFFSLSCRVLRDTVECWQTRDRQGTDRANQILLPTSPDSFATSWVAAPEELLKMPPDTAQYTYTISWSKTRPCNAFKFLLNQGHNYKCSIVIKFYRLTIKRRKRFNILKWWHSLNEITGIVGCFFRGQIYSAHLSGSCRCHNDNNKLVNTSIFVNPLHKCTFCVGYLPFSILCRDRKVVTWGAWWWPGA